MKISVTQNEIDKGGRKDSCFCPVAMACRHAGLLDPTVQPFYICHGKGIERKRIKLPEEVSSFILKFDRGDGPLLRPFEFELDIP